MFSYHLGGEFKGTFNITVSVEEISVKNYPNNLRPFTKLN